MKTDTNRPNVVVVLAAGLGSRLQSDGQGPKPLRTIAGRALILRVLDRFIEAGIREAVVVLGHRGSEIQQAIETDGPACDIHFVFNPDYRRSNGLSVLAAREAVGERPFFLSMSDHIFEGSLIAGLREAPLPDGGLVLAVDRKLDTIYDMDDATVVHTEGDRIAAIHKDLDVYDAVDTGLFKCTTELFEQIAVAKETREDGDCTLSEGVTALINKGLARVHDVGDGLWQDVDTPGSMEHALRLFGSEGIQSDGR